MELQPLTAAPMRNMAGRDGLVELTLTKRLPQCQSTKEVTSIGGEAFAINLPSSANKPMPLFSILGEYSVTDKVLVSFLAECERIVNG